MKRIFLILSVAFLTLSLNAQTNVYSVCGDMEKTYSIVGAKELFGKLWDVTDSSTEMTLEDGIYTYTIENITLDANNYWYKVVVDHSWDESYPEGDYYFVIDKKGTYTITFTFDPITKNLNEEIKEVEVPTSLRTIYLNTGGFWWENNDNYYIYALKDANNHINVKMEYVADYLYRADIDKDCTSVYFYYLSSNNTFTTIDDLSDQYYTETTIPSDKDLYTITSEYMGVYSALEYGEWSVYDSAKSSVSFAYGQTGDVEYAVKRDSTLEITGIGAMEHYATAYHEDYLWWHWSPWRCWMYIIKSISLPEGLTTIGAYAFEFTPNVTSVTIPSTVSIIGSGAFNAQNYSSITCKAVIPPSIAARTSNEEYKHFFQNVDFTIPLYVPVASVNAYKAADYWKDFTNILSIEGGEQPSDEPQPYDEDKEKAKQVQPTAIDLGLPSGNRWSDISVGAALPEQRGNFYQWGCTVPLQREGWDIYCHGTKDAITKYCTLSNYGTVDNLTTLLPEDDAALQNWGNGWRMPTKEEAQELWDNCTRTEEALNGVDGVRFIGRNGKSVFFPFTGWLDEQGNWQNEDPQSGRYWTSSLYEQYNNGAYALSINDTTTGVLPGSQNRHYCRCIRGVLPIRNCQVINEYNITLNQGDSFTFSGRTITPPVGTNDYSVTLLSKEGCDSIITWHVTVNANPQENIYTIQVLANSNYLGTVTGSGTYPKGTSITISATPKQGAKFVKWSDGITSAQRTLQVLKDATYTAIFSALASPSPDLSDRLYDVKSDVINPFNNAQKAQQNKQNEFGNNTTRSQATKILINGQIYILKDNQLFTITGMLVR